MVREILRPAVTQAALMVSLMLGLEPTAGYYGDGGRFLDDIAAKRQELGISDEQIVRLR